MRNRSWKQNTMRWLAAVLVCVCLAAGAPFQGTALADSNPLDEWTVRSPLPMGGQITSIRYLNNSLIALGLQIAISKDGINWTRGMNSLGGDISEMKSVAYGNGVYVVVGRFGNIYSSSDGIVWTHKGLGFNNDLYDVTFSNGRFIAIGVSQSSFISDDNGETWVEQTRTNDNLNYIASNGAGTVVRAGTGGKIISSTDNAATWTQRTSGTSNNFNGLYYMNGRFIGVTSRAGTNGNAVIATSVDGITWTSADSGVYAYLYGAAYDNVHYRYIVVGADGTMLSSMNLTTWEPIIGVAKVTDNLSTVTYGFGKFYAAGPRGVLLTSADGLTWENSFQITAMGVNDLIDAGGTAVAVGESGMVLVSNDGQTWINRSKSGITGFLYSVIYSGDKLVAVGNNGIILTSSDMGLSWDKYDWNEYVGLKSISSGGGVFVAVGGKTTAISTDQGVTWNLNDTDANLNGVAYNNGRFVTVGPSGYIAVSTDNGATWTAKTSGITAELLRVSYLNGKFVTSGREGKIIISADQGETWTIVDKDLGQYTMMQALAYGKGRYMAAGSGNRVVTSLDGETWTDQTTGLSPSTTYTSALFFNDRFILGGGNGLILHSDIIPPPPITYTISKLGDITLSPRLVGYTSGMQETRTITITRTGTGSLDQLAVSLSGAQAGDFEVTQSTASSLNDGTPSATFTVKAKDGLAVGTYTATFTVSADLMTDRTFTVTQSVNLLKGDANGDGQVTPADALYVTKYIKELIELTDEQLESLDMDGDGFVTAEDAKIILNVYLGVDYG